MNKKSSIIVFLILIMFGIGTLAYADHTYSREQNYKCNTIFNNGYLSFIEHKGVFKSDVCFVVLKGGSYVSINDITEEQVGQVVKMEDLRKEPGRPYFSQLGDYLLWKEGRLK